MKNGICGAPGPGSLGDRSRSNLRCELESGHAGWHEQDGAQWNNIADAPPERLTAEEREVIDASVGLRSAERFPGASEVGLEKYRVAVERWRLAVDDLPKPAPSLVERIRKLTLKFGDAWAEERAVMNEAADELERRGANEISGQDAIDMIAGLLRHPTPEDIDRRRAQARGIIELFGRTAKR